MKISVRRIKDILSRTTDHSKGKLMELANRKEEIVRTKIRNVFIHQIIIFFRRCLENPELNIYVEM